MSYTEEIYHSFRRIWGVPATILGTGLTIVGFFYVPDATVAWKWVILAATGAFLITCVLLDLSYRLHCRGRSPLPKVIRSVVLAADPKPSDIRLLLEPSAVFGQQALVSIFYFMDGFEILVAWGYTATVQEDGKIQIALRDIIAPADEALWRAVRNNDARVLQELIIKPSVPINLETNLIP